MSLPALPAGEGSRRTRDHADVVETAGSSAWAPPERVALIGNPNVGKSVIFGLLTGRYSTVSNYPGTTVEVSRGTMTIRGRQVALIDTPGANGLIPQSEDERVTRDLLLEGPVTVLQVADAKNLPRALVMTAQIAEAGLPAVLCLNMSDEAESLGIRIDVEALSRELGIGVTRTIATQRVGVPRLPELLAEARVPRVRIDYGERIESASRRVEGLLPAGPVAPRALAMAAVARDATLGRWLRGALGDEALDVLEETVQDLSNGNGSSTAFVVQRRRMRAATELAERVTSVSRRPATIASARAGAVAMHPVWGLPVAAAVLYAIYLFVGVFGAQTAVGWIEDGLFGGWINPWVQSLFERLSPAALLTDLFVGRYGLLTMGLTYAIAIVLPIVVTFFFAFAVLEDSGYLPRLAVMLNRIFRLMGLNGRAVLPMVLGLGCDTMATLTTRILGTRKERLIVVVLLALGVPCSAQLGVILGMLAGLSWKATAVWGGVVAGVIVLVGWLTARALPGPRSEFIMEIPPLRAPSPLNLLRKTAARVEWYLKEAVPLFLLGTLVLFVADRIAVLRLAESAVEPVVTRLLGLPPQAAEAFLIGFLRRDFGAAGLYRLAESGGLDAVQIVVSLVTITLFIPCIANFFMIVKEMGLRVALLVAAFIFPFAILVGALLNAALRSAGAALT